MVPPAACFSKHSGPEKHSHSAQELYDAGVWIGYFSQEKHTESYRGLPSFSQLRLNGKNFNPPYPPPISGVANEQRQAICRGCFNNHSKFITLKEITFITKTKLVVLPLFDDKGSKGDELFCILITQPNDRSMPKLQAYRPYEICGNGQGKNFVNSFLLLAFRNSSLTNGTLDAIQRSLNPSESFDLSYKTTPPAASSKEIHKDLSLQATQQLQGLKQEDATPTKRITTRRSGGNGASPTTEGGSVEEVVGIFDRLDWLKKQQRLERTKAREDDARMKRKPSDADHDSEPHSKRANTEEASFNRTQQLTPAPSGPVALSPVRKENTPMTDRSPAARPRPWHLETGNPTSPSFSRHQSVAIPSSNTPSKLTEEQAKCVRIIWAVFVEDDMECDFERGLDECETFSDLLELFREDTELDPKAADTLKNTKLWRLMYQLPGHAKKAFNVRIGNELPFERFQETLAQSSIWNDNPDVRFDVQLRALT